MNGLGDTIHFDQASLQKVISLLSETRDGMTKVKEELIQYNETNLKKYWTTAGSATAQSRLENFINGDIESFIIYISARIQNLEESVPYVNQIDQA